MGRFRICDLNEGVVVTHWTLRSRTFVLVIHQNAIARFVLRANGRRAQIPFCESYSR
jgi:hypothetical protein